MSATGAIEQQIDRHLAYEDYCQSRDAYITENPEFAFMWAGVTADEWVWTEHEASARELVRAIASSGGEVLSGDDAKLWKAWTTGMTVEDIAEAAANDCIRVERAVELALFAPPRIRKTWRNKRLAEVAEGLQEKAIEWLLNNERVLRGYEDAMEAERLYRKHGI